MSFINEFFSAVTAGIEGSKKEVRGKRQRSSPGGAAASTDRKEDLTAGQINEVSELMQGGMNGLAQVAGTKLQQQSERIAALEQKTAAISDISSKPTELEDRMRALELRPASSSDPAVATQLADLKRQFEERPTQQQASTAAPAQDVPYHLRTHAVMANLGFDSDSRTVEGRAREVLSAAGFVEDQHFRQLSAMKEKGSMVELFFDTPTDLTRAKVAIRMQKKKFGSNNNTVWCDAKKTRTELRPARIVHRIHECLSDLEKSKPSEVLILKDMPSKSVTRAGHLLGKIVWGKWRWMPEAHEAFSEEQLQLALGWAQQE